MRRRTGAARVARGTHSCRSVERKGTSTADESATPSGSGRTAAPGSTDGEESAAPQGEAPDENGDTGGSGPAATAAAKRRAAASRAAADAGNNAPALSVSGGGQGTAAGVSLGSEGVTVDLDADSGGAGGSGGVTVEVRDTDGSSTGIGIGVPEHGRGDPVAPPTMSSRRSVRHSSVSAYGRSPRLVLLFAILTALGVAAAAAAILVVVRHADTAHAQRQANAKARFAAHAVVAPALRASDLESRHHADAGASSICLTAAANAARGNPFGDALQPRWQADVRACR